MFQNCFKIELKKALLNKKMLVTLALALSLASYHAAALLLNYRVFFAYYEADTISGNPMVTSYSLFARWLGADVASFSTSAFFFLLPMMAVLPYGWSLAGELKSGYIKNVLHRTSRSTYFLSKYMAGFVSGALVVMIPLIYSILVLAIFLPALKMEKIYPYGTIGQGCMWSGIYYEHPYIYCILYIILDGIFAGLMAALSMAAAFFVKSRVTVVLLPFFLMLFLDYMDNNFFMNGEYSPIKFLQALSVANNCYGWAVFLIGLILFLITFGITVCMERNYEVL